MKYILYIKDGNPENNMTIHCNDLEDMVNYASACMRQGYTEVKADVDDRENNLGEMDD